MNTASNRNVHDSSSYQRQVVWWLVLVLVASLSLGACSVGRPQVTPAPTSAPATPSKAPTITPTATLVADSGLPVVDNGEPLPPQLIAMQPQGGQELGVDGKVMLTFDQPMDQAKTDQAWQMLAPDGSKVNGKLQWTGASTLEFVADQKLTPGEIYQAKLDTQAASQAGVALQDPLSFEFQTVSQLQVSQVFPADGSTDVENKAVITVIFNRPVVPLTVAEAQTDLPTPLTISPEVAGQGEWVSTSVYAFHPDATLRGGTSYSVVVNSGLKDAAGETSLDADYSWSFTTTAPAIESFELPDGTTNPPDNYQNVRLDDYFVINFMQPMNQDSTLSALSLTSNKGENVPLETVWNQADTRVVITPTQQLALGTGYRLNLDAQAQSADGGTLKAGLAWNFTTLPPPAIVSTQPSAGTQPSFYGSVYIKFASPMNIKSVTDRIVVSPKPEQDIQWWYNEYDWSVSAQFLEPSTSYTIQFQPGMQDIYGNTINQGRTLRFTTAPRDPSANLQMPYQPAIMRLGGPPDSREFYVSYTNIDSLSFTLSKVSASQLAGFMTGSLSQYNYVPPASDQVWSFEKRSSGALNEVVLESFKPELENGDPLPVGFYFLGMDAKKAGSTWPYKQGPYVDTRLIIVANANLTFKSSTTDVLTWLTDLESGGPLSGVLVNVYDQDFQQIGQGSTDSNGLLSLNVPAPDEPYQPRFVMTADNAAGVFAFASSQWGSGISNWDYGIWGSYYAPTNQPTAYVYTERPIYRPGQPVYFKGIVRLDDDLDYSLPDQGTVLVGIENFKETVYTQTLELSDYGTFDGELLLDQDAVLGAYNLTVRLPGSQNVIGSVSFNVAEYRKPEFQVKVSADPTDVLAGNDFNVNIGAEYYSGGAVSNADLTWTLRSDPFTFTPPDDLSGFNFMDEQVDAGPIPQQQPPTTKIVAQGQGSLDDNGQLTLSLPADLSAEKTSRQFTFEASVSDVTKNVVTGRTTVVAHRSQIYLGARPVTYVGTAGKDAKFEFVAVDWNGNPLPDQVVNVDIVERRWYSVQEQDASGRVQWSTSVQDIPVTSFSDLTVDEQGKVSVSFTPDKGGVYKAYVRATDSRGNPAVSSAYMWVAGAEFIPWRQTNDRSFDLVADRKSYSPGDTAEILIASPFQGQSYALLTVERGHIRQQQVLELNSNSTLYQLPITADMAPNVYVSVMVVKGVDEFSSSPNFKMGITELKVDTSQQTLDVELIPDKTQVGPGEQVSFTVLTRDGQGQPVQAEVSLGLSDLATLSLSSPNSAPILDFFYSQRTLGVWTSMPIGLNIEDYNASIKDQLPAGQGMGSGGGKGEGDFGVIEVRQDFPDTAYWDAHVTTGTNGEATVVVKLPDNLTTWRMDARAVTQDTRVGQTTLDIVSTKPLLVRPQTPRFFVAGDQARIGTAVNNNTDQELLVDVSLEAQGLTLQGEVTQTVDIPAKRQAYVTWNTSINPDAQRVDLVVRAQSQDGTYSDASRPPQGILDQNGIPVYRYEAPETTGTSGQMTTGGSLVEAISLPPSMNISSGQLNIQIAPSLAAGMTDGLTYLKDYPYSCVEQTVSSFLPNVVTTRALKSAGLSDPSLEANLQEQVNSALQRLYNWQNPDGGWGWWPAQNSEQKSDLQNSAYVVLGLLEAKDAGYDVSQPVLDRGLEYLRSQLKPISGLTEPQLLNRQAFVLYVLARSGSADVSRAVQLYEQRQNLSLYARAYLVETLYQVDPGDTRIQTILSDFTNAAVLSASGTHWEENEADPWNWNTDTRTTAIILSVLSRIDPNNPLNANAVRWLMSSRTNGHWWGTQETAWTLMALTNWMEASGELQANYNYAVALNGDRLGGGIADQASLRDTFNLTVPVAELLKDQANRLAFARDDGPGNLYYTAHLNVYLPVDQVEPLDQGITVSRSYFRPDDRNTPVTQAQQGELLYAQLTVVAPNALHYVMVDDPLPAGLEAVDQSLQTSPQNVTPQNYTWDDLSTSGWGWWYFDHIQMHDEKVSLSASYLPAGTYVYTYMVRAATAGTFQTIPPTAQEFYFPEVYGRGAGSQFVVTP